MSRHTGLINDEQVALQRVLQRVLGVVALESSTEAAHLLQEYERKRLDPYCAPRNGLWSRPGGAAPFFPS